MTDLSESCVVRVHWAPRPQRVTMPMCWYGQEEGRSGLEKAEDTVGAENLSSGAFSRDQMSTLHARVYIALGNKL